MRLVTSVPVTEPLLTGYRLTGSSGATPIYCAAQHDGLLCSSRLACRWAITGSSQEGTLARSPTLPVRVALL
jgi:hypothetical protein